MEKQELENLVQQGLSQRDIGDKLGIGQTAVRYWLAKYDLKTTKFFKCKCGETNSEMFAKGRHTSCRKCRNKYQIEKFREYKRLAVEYKGGECEICGYNKCPGAMDFHHRDPSNKDPRWKNMRTWTFRKIKKELDKCQLLCCRCHAELHYWRHR